MEKNRFKDRIKATTSIILTAPRRAYAETAGYMLATALAGAAGVELGRRLFELTSHQNVTVSPDVYLNAAFAGTLTGLAIAGEVVNWRR